jgi:hypothetical protein
MYSRDPQTLAHSLELEMKCEIINEAARCSWNWDRATLGRFIMPYVGTFNPKKINPSYFVPDVFLMETTQKCQRINESPLFKQLQQLAPLQRLYEAVKRRYPILEDVSIECAIVHFDTMDGSQEMLDTGVNFERRKRHNNNPKKVQKKMVVTRRKTPEHCYTVYSLV